MGPATSQLYLPPLFSLLIVLWSHWPSSSSYPKNVLLPLCLCAFNFLCLEHSFMPDIDKGLLHLCTSLLSPDSTSIIVSFLTFLYFSLGYLLLPAIVNIYLLVCCPSLPLEYQLCETQTSFVLFPDVSSGPKYSNATHKIVPNKCFQENK